jgi:hypothetical protein
MSPTASQNQWICIVFSLLAENDVRIIVSCCLLLIAIYVKDKLGDVQCSYTFAAQHFLKREVIMEGTGIPGFGETVATFRTRAGLSQQKVASVLGMSLRAIAAWEAGDNLPKTR